MLLLGIFFSAITLVLIVVAFFCITEEEYPLFIIFLLLTLLFGNLTKVTFKTYVKNATTETQQNFVNCLFTKKAVIVSGVFADKIVYKEDTERNLYIDNKYSSVKDTLDVKIGDILSVTIFHDKTNGKNIIIDYEIIK